MRRLLHAGAYHDAVQVALIIAGGALLLWLGLYGQPYYPATWIDEGFALQGPTNLLRYGAYAMRSAEGLRVLDQPLIANGPGLGLPLAGVFALFGPGLLAARLTVVGYMLVAGAAFYAVGRRLFGPGAAAVSLFLLLALPAQGFVLYGRQALGNVPALAYFLLGYLAWLQALDRRAPAWAGVAGLAFGVALATKGQYVLLIPILGLAGAVQILLGRRNQLRLLAAAMVATAAGLAIWYAAQWAIVGADAWPAHLRAVQASAAVTVFAFRPARIPGSAAYLLRSGVALVAVPGAVYAGLEAWRRRGDGRLLPLVLFVPVWLTWYLFASVGWPRYAFEAAAVGALLAGKFVADAPRLAFDGRRRSISLALVGALIVVAGGWGLGRQARGVVLHGETAAHDFAAHLQATVPAGAVVESWEWELDALADLTYHHPTNDVVDAMTARLQFGDTPAITYDPLAYAPEYLIDGPFSKWTALYADTLAGDCCRLLHSDGGYDLYAVETTPAH